MFCFVDASHAASPYFGSLEAYVLFVWKVKKRDGDFVEEGCLVGRISRKIHRVRRSSLAAEVVASCDGFAVAIRSKALIVEAVSGKFLKELLEPMDKFTRKHLWIHAVVRRCQKGSYQVDGIGPKFAQTKGMFRHGSVAKGK